MYDRFTDRARKVMQLANQEAQRFNHEYIDTFHMLLGLVKEGTGVGANVLKNLNVDLRKARLEVEKVVQAGPDMISMGKLPQTPDAKKAVENSMVEARELNHSFVGTEHILLGLLHNAESLAAKVLNNMGVELEAARAEVLNVLGRCEEEELETASLKSGDDIKWIKKWTANLNLQAAQDPAEDNLLLDEETMRQVRVSLTRRTRRNVLLVGHRDLTNDYVLSFAHQVAHQQVPEALQNLEIRKYLNTYTSEKSENDVASLLIKCLAQTIPYGHFALVLNNYDNLFGFRIQETGKTLGHAIVPWIRCPNVRVIGTTTEAGFERILDQETTLRHFTIIRPPELTREQMERRLKFTVRMLGDHYLCEFAPPAIELAIDTGISREDSGIGFPPSLANDILDLAAAETVYNRIHEDEKVQKLEHRLRLMQKKIQAKLAAGDFVFAGTVQKEFDSLKAGLADQLPVVSLQTVEHAIATMFPA